MQSGSLTPLSCYIRFNKGDRERLGEKRDRKGKGVYIRKRAQAYRSISRYSEKDLQEIQWIPLCLPRNSTSETGVCMCV